MAEINYRDSEYRFRSPVRYFTANDPYYWEVDNIPLQQLMENDLWLRDQLTQGGGSSFTGINRRDINELKPYVDETNNIVKVKPGRFTARINDISSSVKFQEIRRIAGQMFNERHTWEFTTYDSTAVQSNIDKIVSEVETDATFLNGLSERAFTHPSVTPYIPYIDYRTGASTWNPNLPLRDIVFFIVDPTTGTIPGSDNRVIGSNFSERQEAQMVADQSIQPYFMQYWRGVARTSVVDVPEELEIEIPAFNLSDFDYIDRNGNVVSRPGAELRIDLLFVYSKPIDSLESKVLDPTNPEGRRVITRAELGIVKGAGAVFSLLRGNRTTVEDDGGFDEVGNPQIVGSVADHKGTFAGFSNEGVHGSFPSPDDLMNISPLISEQLEDNDPFLIGQTVLPIAYVVVRKNPSVNQAGVQVLTESSIIDIRPFFRTTELSYNERAGIAAAMPSLSISNPVVTKLELRYETKRLYDDYISRINPASQGLVDGSFPRVVAAGYVMGGSLFGPEAAIQEQYLRQNPNLTPAQLISEMVAKHGYRPDIIIPSYPDWDLARWATDFAVAGNLSPGPGTQRNDWVNLARRGDINTAEEEFDFGSFETTERLNRIKKISSEAFQGKADILFVKKTFTVDRSQIGWDVEDFHVTANFFNCVPLSCRYNSNDDRVYPGASDIWISKTPNGFTIYVAWSAASMRTTGNGGGPEYPSNARSSRNYSGFLVTDGEMFNRLGSKGAANARLPGEPAMGISTYPTVTFQVIGMPTAYRGMATNTKGNLVRFY